MYLNMLIFILMFGLIQGGLMISVLLARKKIEPFHIFLCGYIAVLLLQLLFKVMNKIWLMHHFIQPYSMSYYLPLLYGPLIYLFAKNYSGKSRALSLKDLLHFIPFTIYLVAFSFIDAAKFPSVFMRFLMHPVNRLIFQLISMGAYHFVVFSLLKKKNENGPALHHTRQIFLRRFSMISMFVTTTIAVTLYFLYTRFPHYQEVRWVFVLLTGFIYWLSFEALKKPELFRVILGNAKSVVNDYSIPYLKVHHATEKYAHSSLKEEESKRILSLLEKMMDEEKIYLDPSVNIDMIADKISCRKHHLSQVLNEKMKKSFNELMNEKRIREARELLSDPAFNHFKIASVAFDTGFKSLSSFNEIFKKREGVTPSQYRIVSQQENRSQISRV
jgi:AraC-like DNA-binding protein